jgi:hypothetical protein
LEREERGEVNDGTAAVGDRGEGEGEHVCTNVTAESEDCGEVYLENLSSQLLVFFSFQKLGRNIPHSNHYPETPHLGAVVGSLHSLLGY